MINSTDQKAKTIMVVNYDPCMGFNSKCQQDQGRRRLTVGLMIMELVLAISVVVITSLIYEWG